MSPTDDYVDDMANEALTDAAIEAFFLGSPDPGWEHEASLATLADDMTMALSGPTPIADHALLQLFWTAPTPAESAHPGVGADDDRRAPVGFFRRRARLVVGAATGTAVALLSVSVAGATGVLPDPAQRVVARVVEAISPFELPRPAGPSGGGLPSPQDTGGTSSSVDQQPGVNAPGAPSGHADATPGSVPPADPGSTGLDRAGQTPASKSIPPFVPGAGTPPNPSPPISGAPQPPGLDTARQTPAGTAVPASIPKPAIPSPARNHGR